MNKIILYLCIFIAVPLLTGCFDSNSDDSIPPSNPDFKESIDLWDYLVPTKAITQFSTANSPNRSDLEHENIDWELINSSKAKAKRYKEGAALNHVVIDIEYIKENKKVLIHKIAEGELDGSPHKEGLLETFPRYYTPNKVKDYFSAAHDMQEIVFGPFENRNFSLETEEGIKEISLNTYIVSIKKAGPSQRKIIIEGMLPDGLTIRVYPEISVSYYEKGTGLRHETSYTNCSGNLFIGLDVDYSEYCDLEKEKIIY